MIIRPFNAAYLRLLAFAAGAVVLLWVLLRGRSERCRAAVLIALCAVNIIGFFVYKGFLSRDVQFLQASGLDRFNWFNELPLQLCLILPPSLLPAIAYLPAAQTAACSTLPPLLPSSMQLRKSRPSL